jgi:hypothetical protein
MGDHKTCKELTRDDVDIEIICEPEWIPIEGNAIASGEPDVDAAEVKRIRDELDNGNVWAWCIVTVKVSYKGLLSATDSLGACSYEDEADFRGGDYFDDMVSEALKQLNKDRNAICGC